MGPRNGGSKSGATWLCSPASVGTAAKKIRASDAFGRLLWRAEPAAQGWSPDECADVAEQLVHLMALGLGAEVAPLLLLLDGAHCSHRSIQLR